MNARATAPLSAALFARKGDASAEGFAQPAPTRRRRFTPWNRGACVRLALAVGFLISATVAMVSRDSDDASPARAPPGPVDTVAAARAVAAVQPAPTPKPQTVSIPVAMPPAKPIRRVAPPPAATGRYRVQLASLGSAAAVRREWTRLKSAHRGVFSGLRLIITLDPSRAFYRLQAGPVTSHAAARKLCAKLRRPRAGCLIVARKR